MRSAHCPILIGLLCLTLIATACGGGGSGGGRRDSNDDDPPPQQVVVPPDIIALHDSDLASTQPSCQSEGCHPDRMDRYAPHRDASGQQVENFHYLKAKSLSAFFSNRAPEDLEDQDCTVCHKRVRLLTATGGTGTDPHLRRMVDTAFCAGCHGSSGPGPQLYSK